MSDRRLRFTQARYTFQDVQWLWNCRGWGASGYGETVDEAFRDWWSCLRFLYTWRPLGFIAWCAYKRLTR